MNDSVLEKLGSILYDFYKFYARNLKENETLLKIILLRKYVDFLIHTKNKS